MNNKKAVYVLKRLIQYSYLFTKEERKAMEYAAGVLEELEFNRTVTNNRNACINKYGDMGYD